MAFDPVTAVLGIGGKLIDKFIPDAGAKDAAKLELFKLQQSGELQVLAIEAGLIQGQLEINKAEAGNSSLFVSGWRPAVGWVCVIGLFYTFMARPLLVWYSSTHGINVPPELNTGDLFTLLAGMLGLAGLRTGEKIKGVAR